MRLGGLWRILELVFLQDVAEAPTPNVCPGHETLSSNQIFLGLMKSSCIPHLINLPAKWVMSSLVDWSKFAVSWSDPMDKGLRFVASDCVSAQLLSSSVSTPWQRDGSTHVLIV
jgi:hypothetical protein